MKRIVRSRAPLRLGIAGGGTDVSPYCDQYGGYILNATIDRYAYCTINEIDEPCVHFIAADRKLEKNLSLDLFPFALDGSLDLHFAVYNRMIREYNDNKPLKIKITTFCDAPVGSGLGASSTVVVAIIRAYDEYLGLGLDDYNIAHIAYQIERKDCDLRGGRQDQYSATFGGFNFMEFYAEDRVLVNPLRVRNWIICELEASLILYYTGKSRLSGSIIDCQSMNIKKENEKSLEAMHGIKLAALKMKEALLKGDFDNFVKYLNLGWKNKKLSAEEVTNPFIENVYQTAMDAGALGGKISGAGGGGFMTFFVPPESRTNVIQALKKKGGAVSNCHFSNAGSQCWTVYK